MSDDTVKRWEKDEELRSEILRMQHEEIVALHAQFSVRSEHVRAADEAQLREYASVIEHRALMIAAIDKQTAVMERIAAALEARSQP